MLRKHRQNFVVRSGRRGPAERGESSRALPPTSRAAHEAGTLRLHRGGSQDLQRKAAPRSFAAARRGDVSMTAQRDFHLDAGSSRAVAEARRPDPSLRRIAILGASGALGRTVRRRATGRRDIRLVNDPRDPPIAALEVGVRHASRYSRSALEAGLGACDAVIFCAWDFRPTSDDYNIDLLESVLLAAETVGVKRFVFPSSVAAYASLSVDPRTPCREDLVLSIDDNLSEYGRQKLRCETRLRASPLPHVVARIAPILLSGRQSYTSRLLRTRALTSTLGPNESLQFVSVNDAADVLLLAATEKRDCPGEIVNVAADDAVRVTDIETILGPSITQRRRIADFPARYPSVSTHRLTQCWSFACSIGSRDALQAEVGSWLPQRPPSAHDDAGGNS
jgi:nucleoside-diphosphate-sugar epimerase